MCERACVFHWDYLKTEIDKIFHDASNWCILSKLCQKSCDQTFKGEKKKYQYVSNFIALMQNLKEANIGYSSWLIDLESVEMCPLKQQKDEGATNVQWKEKKFRIKRLGQIDSNQN